MKELIDEISLLMKGELLSEEEGKIALKLLLNDDPSIYGFSNEEVTKIYIDVKARINFAPEENQTWELGLVESIINTIENTLKKNEAIH